MKIRKAFLLLCLSLVGASAESLQTSPALTIVRIDKQDKGDWVMVNNGWSQTIPRLRVLIRSVKDCNVSSLVVRAYFYDAEKKLVKKYAAPASARHEENGKLLDVVFEDYLKGNKDWPVYFPITEDMKAARWQSALIFFSDGKSTAVKVYPGGKPEDFNYDEKGASPSSP